MIKYANTKSKSLDPLYCKSALIPDRKESGLDELTRGFGLVW